MSVFKVVLNTPAQGTMDINPITGLQSATSAQRTVYVTGPNLVTRKLVDGATFTDCNYYKRFCTPVATAEAAFLQCTVDDGSVYDNVLKAGVASVADTVTVLPSTTYTDAANIVDLSVLNGVAQTGAYATYLEVSSDFAVTLKINGGAGAVFSLGAGDTEIFAPNGAYTSVAFANASSANTATVQVNAIVKVPAQS